MPVRHPAPLAATLALLTACTVAGCAPSAAPAPTRPPARVAVRALGDAYADLEWQADSVVAAHAAGDDAPSELAQVTARNLDGRIRAVHGEFERVSMAMTADEYERGLSLWMRLAMAHAALELLDEDAARLAADPATAAADVHDLAARLAGALELGRVSARMAERTFAAPAAVARARAAGVPR